MRHCYVLKHTYISTYRLFTIASFMIFFSPLQCYIYRQLNVELRSLTLPSNKKCLILQVHFSSLQDALSLSLYFFFIILTLIQILVLKNKLTISIFSLYKSEFQFSHYRETKETIFFSRPFEMQLF